MKLIGQTHRKAYVNSIFIGKFVVIFFKPPLQGVKHFKGPLFASGPVTSVLNGSLSMLRPGITIPPRPR